MKYHVMIDSLGRNDAFVKFESDTEPDYDRLEAICTAERDGRCVVISKRSSGKMDRLTFRVEKDGRIYSKVPGPVAISKLGKYEDAEEQGRIWIASPELQADIDDLLSDEAEAALAGKEKQHP